jgi:predicted metal-dependent hydrolase
VKTQWRHGITLFERGEYWECHEALEPHWLESEGLERAFLSGLILLAASLHKARVMNNPRGGRRNYAKALMHLAAVPDVYQHVNVRALEACVHIALRDPRYTPEIPYRQSEITKG